MNKTDIRPAFIPLLCAALPFLAVHLTLANSIVNAHVPYCIPYFQGCTTISQAARSGESIFLFRALMLPTAGLLVIYWLITFAWLQELGGETVGSMKVMCFLGVVGAIFLVLYATFLGSEGDFYRWMRRYGVIVFFSFTALAQIFFTRRLYHLEHKDVLIECKNLIHTHMVLCALQWGIGIISVVLGFIIASKDARYIMQNIVEWNFALAMNANFFISYLLYKKTGVYLQVRLQNE